MGEYATLIWSAYAACGLIMAAVAAASWRGYRKSKQKLAELEQ